MQIVLTNDDGYSAPGLVAAYNALTGLGDVHVIAPMRERSACSHAITLRSPINVERREQESLGSVYAVDGTPADCVRLAFAALVSQKIDLVVSGINRGANAGVDTFYSGTVAGAREAALLGINAISVSQAIRNDVETDWAAAAETTAGLLRSLVTEPLPGPGFWNINLPAPIPDEPQKHIRRVPIATHPMPMTFDRQDSKDGRVMSFEYGASYWLREVDATSDYTTVRDGEIAVTPVPLFARF